jgi:PKD repeat protein
MINADFSEGGLPSADGFLVAVVSNPIPMWQVLTYGGTGCPDPGSAEKHSSPHAIWFGNKNVCTYGPQANLNLRVADYPEIDLQEASAATLWFRYFLQTEGYDGNDIASVQVSVNGGAGPFVTVADNQDGIGGLVDGGPDWQTATVDLTPFVGHEVWLRFEFNADAVDNSYAGWHVDDVRISTAPRVIDFMNFGNFVGLQVDDDQQVLEGGEVTVTAAIDPSVTVTTLEWESSPQVTDTDGDPNSFTFTPPTEGSYTLTAVVNRGSLDEYSDTATIFVGDVPPVFEYAPGQQGAGPDIKDDPDTPEDESLGEGQTFTRPLAIVDPGDDDWQVTIDYGDGATETFITATRVLDSNNPNGFVNHAYSTKGTYTVIVTVVGLNDPLDPSSVEGSFTDSFQVQVHSLPPVISFGGGGGSGNSAAGASAAPAALSSGSGESDGTTIDEGGAFSTTIQISDPSASLQQTFTGTVSWGDGSPAEPFTLIVSGASGSKTITHVYDDDGQYTVTVTVSDEDGDQATATYSVTVVNVAPTIETMSGPVHLLEGQSGGFSAVASDPGDDPLTYAWDFGDGSPQGHGDVVQHTFADDGVYLVTLTVQDGDGGVTVSTRLVSVENAAPTVAAVPQLTVNEGQLLSLAGLVTITDPGFANAALGLAETFTSIIDWGDSSTPQSGSVTVDTVGAPGVPTVGSLDANHTYADDGVYTVTVTVTDDDGGSGSTTVQVTVRNVAPTATATADQTIDEGFEMSLSPLAIISDPGFRNAARGSDETFSYTIHWGDGSPPETGTATVDLVGSVGQPTMASLGGSHTYADDGTYTITVTVTDDDEGSSVDSLQVTVHNVAPQVSVDQPGSAITTGELLRLDGWFTDPGADSWQVLVDYTGSGQFFPAARSGKTFRLAYVYPAAGTYPASVKVRDDEGLEGTALFEVVVTPQNRPPEVTQLIGDQSLTAYECFQFIVDDGTFSDPDPGDVLSYSATLSDGTPLPGWLSFDSATRTFGGRPTNIDAGTLNVTVQATDSGDPPLSAATTFAITVNENPHPHQNPENPFDVDNDQQVKPLDVQLVINYLNTYGVGLLPAPTGCWQTQSLFVDTSGDNIASAVDVLLVINYLNSLAAGEGESSADDARPQPVALYSPTIELGEMSVSGVAWAETCPANTPPRIRQDCWADVNDQCERFAWGQPDVSIRPLKDAVPKPAWPEQQSDRFWSSVGALGMDTTHNSLVPLDADELLLDIVEDIAAATCHQTMNRSR